MSKSARAAAPATRPARSRPKSSRRQKARYAIIATAGACCLAAGGVAVMLATGGGQPHSISAPSRIGPFVDEPALATGMGASTLRNEIVSHSNGEATNVVDAVYEETTGPAAKGGPVIILFVGGNLSGSAGSFIDGLTSALPGAFVINPGSLQGQAACVPGLAGHLSECAWADNDTFGVIASPSLSATALGAELRLIRPQVEHARK